MTGTGWLIMLVSMTSVIGLLVYCLFKVFSLPSVEVEEHMQGQPFIDTKDTKNGD